MLRGVILLLALGPFIYYLLTLWASVTYFRGSRLVSRGSGDTPPASILKPVRGLDREAYENFASFCFQDYPEYEVLFCVNDASDPAVPVIQELRNDFPDRQIRLLIGADSVGASGKVNKLCRLAREARYDLLVISDSDVRVEPNYLREVAAPFADKKVGAVTVFFRSTVDGGIGTALDAVGSGVEFASSALLAQKLEGIHFTLGATMGITKQVLSQIGGFEALADYYVDDYEIGNRISRLGYKIVFAPTPVCMVYPRESLGQFLRHELRWTIGLRNVRPGGHLAVGLVLGFPWTVLAIFAAPSAFIAFLYVAAYLLLRYSVYVTIGAWGLRDPVVQRKWWLAPVRDIAAFGVWVASFFSSRITWRGLEFRVKKGLLIPVGRMVPTISGGSVQAQSPSLSSFEVSEHLREATPVFLEPSKEFATRTVQSSEIAFEKTPELG